MTIKVKKVGALYTASVSPPEGKAWQSLVPMTLAELTAKSNELGVHTQDFWDAVVAADPTVAERSC